MFIEISPNLKKLSKFFPEHLYVVGGYVRSCLMHLKNEDVDITSPVSAEEVVKRLKGSEFSVKVKNLKLGSLLITKGDENFQYTAFRKEIYGNDGSHTPIKVEGTTKLEEDAVRRDLTINSIYYNINKDECVDLYHGVVDTNQKLIRTNINSDDILKNDGERILRIVRLAGELNFNIEKSTFLSVKKFVTNVNDLQGNRKFGELEKILYCDKRYGIGSLKKALGLMNILGVWQNFGLACANVRYKMVFKTQDRLLGLLIDIVDTEKVDCLEAFLEKFLYSQCALPEAEVRKIIIFISGYYDALQGLGNKEYFFKYFENWADIYALLGCKSKRLQARYNFFYQYILEHGLAIKVSDLEIDEEDIAKNFNSIDKKSYNRILKNLLSKVFDGKVKNEKEALLQEIKKNLINY